MSEEGEEKIIIEEAESNSQKENYKFKVVVVGDSGVGKTNLIKRFINNEFKSDSKATVGVEFLSKNFIINNEIFKIEIWDTAGQERYKSITSAYYKGAKGAFVVYDLTRRATFTNIEKWIGELKTCGNEDVFILLIGNKCDLKSERQVTKDEAAKKAEQLKISYCETSALDGKNIEYAFDTVVEEVAKKNSSDNNEVRNEKNSKGVTLDTGGNKDGEDNKKTCCSK